MNTSTGFGGLEMNLLKLARALRAKGMEIHIVCKENSRFSEQLNGEFKTLFLSKTKKYFDFANARMIVSYAKQEGVQTIFSVYRPDLDMLAWSKKFYPSLRIIHQQHMQIGIAKKGIFQRMRYAAVDSWLAPLEYLKQEVIEKTVVSRERISVVPIGLDTSYFTNSLITKSDARSFFNLPQDVFLLGVIGRIDEKKGQLFVLKALKQLRDRGEEVHLLIVGEPTIDDAKTTAYYQEIQNYIKLNNLSDNVHIRPFTKEIINFYKAIDICVMSSEGETYGMVTIEAMLSKTPVIGTNSVGTPEVLEQGKLGKLFEFNNVDSLINAYAEMRNALETNSWNLDVIQQKAQDRFSIEKEVKGVVQSIESVIQK